jgi:hypothetical protein
MGQGAETWLTVKMARYCITFAVVEESANSPAETRASNQGEMDNNLGGCGPKTPPQSGIAAAWSADYT